MSTTVTVNNTTFTLPAQSDNAPWGADLSDLIAALVEVANTVVSVGDIAATTFTLANNISSAASVTGLTFDISTILSSTITYTVYRTTDSNEVTERGVILLAYKPTANTFELAQYHVGDAGVEFTVNSSGQFLYTSSNIAGTNYAGTLKFSAKSTVQ